jgi:hypothetical protein
MSTKDLESHRREITGQRRKNNIYGERTDFIIESILNLGCDAAFYNPVDTNNIHAVSIYARSEAHLYLIKILYAVNAQDVPEVSEGDKLALGVRATYNEATPIYAIAKNYARSVKFYDMKDKRIHNFE